MTPTPAEGTPRPLATQPAPKAAPAPAPSALKMRLSTIGQLSTMLRAGGRWWLLPMMGLLALMGLVLSALAAIQYVAPFIYAIM